MTPVAMGARVAGIGFYAGVVAALASSVVPVMLMVIAFKRWPRLDGGLTDPEVFG